MMMIFKTFHVHVVVVVVLLAKKSGHESYCGISAILNGSKALKKALIGFSKAKRFR